jgi:CxxC motif-containing protein
MICINCPKGCELDVFQAQDGSVTVQGQACPRGETYGKAELVNPTRMVTGLVRIAGMRKPLPVKTASPIPKGKINDVLFALHQTTVQLPVKIGDVIVKDVACTGVDIVATANM